MIRSLWSKLVRLLSGEMDLVVLRNEVAQKWLDGMPLLPGEKALLETLGKTDSMLSFYLGLGIVVHQVHALVAALPGMARSMVHFTDRMRQAEAQFRAQFLDEYRQAVQSPRQ